MKKLKLNLPILWLSVIFALVLVASVIIACVFGFNTSVEMSGGNRLRINLTNANNISYVKKQAEAVYSSNGICIENSYVEDYRGESYLVLISRKNDNVNYNELRVLVSEKTELELNQISNIEEIKTAVPSNYFVMFGISMIILAVLAFVFGFIRYKLAGALAITIGSFATIVAHLALINLTRVPLSYSTFVTAAIFWLIFLLLMVTILENVRTKQNSKATADASEYDLVSDSLNDTLMPAYVVIIFTLIVGFTLICLKTNYVKYLGINAILGLFASLFTILFMASLYTIFLEVDNIRFKRKTSKNPNLTTNRKKR